MTVEAIVAPARPTLRDLVWRGIAWALVTLCLAMLGTLFLAGERPATYAELRAAVAEGRVDEIHVDRGLHGQVDGSSVATVHWRDGLMGRVTSLTEATSPRDARSAGMPEPIVEGRVDDHLAALDPALRATRSTDRPNYTDVGPWQVPGWMDVGAVVLFLGAFAVLVAGPAPWRATRWAWFWVIGGVPIVGALAFLLLGGSTSVLRPRHPERRLNGGLAFALVMVTRLALAAAAAALF